MPDYRYTGEAGRTYPFHPEDARTPTPGSTYRLPKNPDDGRWQPAKTAAAKKTARKRAAKNVPPEEPAVNEQTVQPDADAGAVTDITEER